MTNLRRFLVGSRAIALSVTPRSNALMFAVKTTIDGLSRQLIAGAAIAAVAILSGSAPLYAQTDASEVEWHLLSETDWFGGDITGSGHRDVSVGQCEAICASSDRCSGYTYVIDQNWCWPKYDTSEPLERPGLLSALRTDSTQDRSQSLNIQVGVVDEQADWQLFENTDVVGGDLTEHGYRNVSIGECEAICASMDRCSGYTYVIEKNWCWPKDDTSNIQVDRPGLVSALLYILDGGYSDPVASAPSVPDVPVGACSGWNTQALFERADAEEIMACFAEGAGVQARDGNGWSPLHFAARYGTVETVTALLDAGADINARSNQKPCVLAGLSGVGAPLHLAARHGSADTIALMIAVGADVEARDGPGDTPLRSAAASGDATKVQMLLDAGADPNTRNDLCCNGCGGTILGTAIGTDSIEMVRLLLDAGADVNYGWGNAPIALAAAAFDDAVAPNRFEMIQLLLDAGADPNMGEANGRSLLDYDEVIADVEMMRILLAAGADPENPQGLYSPLRQAVEMGKTQTVRLLLDAGANPNIDTDSGPLFHEAVRKGSAEIVRALVDAGARIEGRDSQGETALRIAQKQGHTEIINTLRGAGLDIETGSRRPGRPPKFAFE